MKEDPSDTLINRLRLPVWVNHEGERWLSSFHIDDMAIAANIVEAADELVALWENQKIEGLSRSERNKTIEETREKLIKAVKEARDD